MDCIVTGFPAPVTATLSPTTEGNRNTSTGTDGPFYFVTRVTHIISTCNSNIAYTCTGKVGFIQQNVTATPRCRKCANEQPELGLQSRPFYWLIHTVIATIHANLTDSNFHNLASTPITPLHVHGGDHGYSILLISCQLYSPIACVAVIMATPPDFLPAI